MVPNGPPPSQSPALAKVSCQAANKLEKNICLMVFYEEIQNFHLCWKMMLKNDEPQKTETGQGHKSWYTDAGCLAGVPSKPWGPLGPIY